MTEKRDLAEHLSIRFRNILFSTDFSDVSAKALPYAAAIARRFGSTLYVVHVIPPEPRAYVSPQERDSTLEQMQHQAEEGIAALLASAHFNGISHRVVLTSGELWPTLSVVATEHNIDLMVTGTHGKHGIQKLFSGSMAEGILRLAARPVLMVGPEVDVTPEAEVHLERILCVADFLPDSRRSMEYGYALASAYAAQLYFLYVEHGDWAELSTQMSAGEFFRFRLRERGWPEKEGGIQPEFVVRSGPPELVTLEVANKHQIQLIVLHVPGTSHPDLTSHLPGPLAYNIASHARCPVLTVRGATEQ